MRLDPVTPERFADLRDVRLRALADAPLAFGSTLAGESPLGDDDWRQRAARWANGRSSVAYLARDGDEDRVCGIAAGFLVEGEPSIASLASMWVAPTHRGRGVGRQLVDAVADWARSRGARTLRLDVTSCNDAAIAFYRRLGFAMTGQTEPYENDDRYVEHEMARPLVGESGTRERLLRD